MNTNFIVDKDGNRYPYDQWQFKEVLQAKAAEAISNRCAEVLVPFENEVMASGGTASVEIAHDLTRTSLVTKDLPDELVKRMTIALEQAFR